MRLPQPTAPNGSPLGFSMRSNLTGAPKELTQARDERGDPFVWPGLGLGSFTVWAQLDPLVSSGASFGTALLYAQIGGTRAPVAVAYLSNVNNINSGMMPVFSVSGVVAERWEIEACGADTVAPTTPIPVLLAVAGSYGAGGGPAVITHSQVRLPTADWVSPTNFPASWQPWEGLRPVVETHSPTDYFVVTPDATARQPPMIGVLCTTAGNLVARCRGDAADETIAMNVGDVRYGEFSFIRATSSAAVLGMR